MSVDDCMNAPDWVRRHALSGLMSNNHNQVSTIKALNRWRMAVNHREALRYTFVIFQQAGSGRVAAESGNARRHATSGCAGWATGSDVRPQ
ncbi:hypothetical protein [Paraburkholderia diazotrophica]|uniref:hypothetical protein n=1 Tax=Paraburkholderia diazotrophica TaxID=667676 RepID=UPI00115FAF05|nr:hypothetical protein [Paraburkholderia diazotrophica]